jgi:hypothetical protein
MTRCSDQRRRPHPKRRGCTGTAGAVSGWHTQGQQRTNEASGWRDQPGVQRGVVPYACVLSAQAGLPFSFGSQFRLSTLRFRQHVPHALSTTNQGDEPHRRIQLGTTHRWVGGQCPVFVLSSQSAGREKRLALDLATGSAGFSRASLTPPQARAAGLFLGLL